VVFEVIARLDAQEGQVETAVGECNGEVRRVVARDRHLDLLQLVVQQLHRRRQPVHLVPGLEADGERLPFGLRGSACGFDRGVGVHQHEPGVLEKGRARGGQLDTAHAAREQLDPDVRLEVADLPAQRRL
jgi:hypothetical protein